MREIIPNWNLQRTLDGCTKLEWTNGKIRSRIKMGSSHDGWRLSSRCCRGRGCKWCDYKLRLRHRPKIRRVMDLASADPDRWRFSTFTLPGNNYQVRGASLNDQLSTWRRAWKMFRNRHRNSDAWWSLGKVTSSYVLEYPCNDGVWHLHGHALMNVPDDFDTLFDDKVKKYNSQWLECIDKEKTFELRDSMPIEKIGSPIDFQRITDDGLVGYMTKASGYLTKSSGWNIEAKEEVDQTMFRKKAYGTTGQLWGTKYGRIRE